MQHALDAVLTRLEAKVDALPSRAFIAGALAAVVLTATVMVLAALAVTGGLAPSVSR